MLTKLDGTARGGVVLTIREELDVPVKFIGVGEGVDDLMPFDPDDFAHGLFRLFGAAHIGEKNLKAVAGKGLGDGPADAARTAGHQGRGERLCGGRRGLRCAHAGSAFAVGTWNAVYSSDTGEFQCARAPVSGVARHGMR